MYITSTSLIKLNNICTKLEVFGTQSKTGGKRSWNFTNNEESSRAAVVNQFCVWSRKIDASLSAGAEIVWFSRAPHGIVYRRLVRPTELSGWRPTNVRRIQPETITIWKEIEI